MHPALRGLLSAPSLRATSVGEAAGSQGSVVRAELPSFPGPDPVLASCLQHTPTATSLPDPPPQTRLSPGSAAFMCPSASVLPLAPAVLTPGCPSSGHTSVSRPRSWPGPNLPCLMGTLLFLQPHPRSTRRPAGHLGTHPFQTQGELPPFSRSFEALPPAWAPSAQRGRCLYLTH